MGTILVFTAILALCFMGLGFNILFRKNGKFPATEIERNKEMRRRGIYCAREVEMVQFKRARKLKEIQDCGACITGLCSEPPSPPTQAN